MEIKLEFSHRLYEANLSKGIDLSIPIKNGLENPNCYWSDPVEFKTIKGEGFIGSVEDGGVVNHKKISITPHGNGTHTECYGHISADKDARINRCLDKAHLIAELISVTPTKSTNLDSTITAKAIQSKNIHPNLDALIIRTLPNGKNKKSLHYSGTNPTYLTPESTLLLRKMGIKHLLVDLPSVDREEDQGKLLAHKNFWYNKGTIRKDCTITELIYVDNSLDDGLYLLNLQTINLDLDVSPSRPVIYKLNSL